MKNHSISPGVQTRSACHRPELRGNLFLGLLLGLHLIISLPRADSPVPSPRTIGQEISFLQGDGAS
ncbi:MAG: hypothetical protein HC810_08255 [Acaryochloridaceae cyanobacterium RL_2_7]|nr:hypothetical protein [Acaryochloridaceae cyanobacterium RL_2_7]